MLQTQVCRRRLSVKIFHLPQRCPVKQLGHDSTDLWSVRSIEGLLSTQTAAHWVVFIPSSLVVLCSVVAALRCCDRGGQSLHHNHTAPQQLQHDSLSSENTHTNTRTHVPRFPACTVGRWSRRRPVVILYSAEKCHYRESATFGTNFI